MNNAITDLRNIVENKLEYKKIVSNIQIDLTLSPGFAGFIPELLGSNNRLISWYNKIINKSEIKNNFRNKIIQETYDKEINELEELKKIAQLNSYYLSQQKFAKPFLIQNSLEIDDLSINFLNRRLLYLNKIKLNKIEILKNRNLSHNLIFSKIENILKEIDQIKACKKVFQIRKENLIDNKIHDKIRYKKYLLLKKINSLKLFHGAESGIGFERLGFDILKKFAKNLGHNYYVGEILSNNIWKLRENKKKGMKQDLDGFIFKIVNGIIIVEKIYEFKSSHLAIIEDISKLEKLIDYLIKFNYELYFKKCNDGIFRPTKDNINTLIMNKLSFPYIKFKNNRYQNIKYIFKINEEVKNIKFNYLTISQFNKTKNIKDLEIRKKNINNFLQTNKKSITNINKVALNGGLIGVLIEDNKVDNNN